MTRTLPRFHIPFNVALACLMAGGIVGFAPASSDVAHFGLAKSTPADESAVEAPVESLELWFTQVPQEGSITIRLILGEEPLEIAKPAQDENDGKHFSVDLGDGIGAGAYIVAWRGIGEDGHVVRGDFAFTVTAQ